MEIIKPQEDLQRLLSENAQVVLNCGAKWYALSYFILKHRKRQEFNLDKEIRLQVSSM